jgi:L-2-hydroxyglutarate oxidase LhgO
MRTDSGDFVVIGAGVVGLALARQLLIEHPAAVVVVLDKEPRLAEHASGRNSGVLHAGFYYSPDSLKARLTRRGNELLHRFCEENRVPVRRCGKVVVARSAEELPALRMLAERGAANGVEVEVVDESGLRELEPLARTVDRALFSPTTSMADPASVVAALATDVRRRGGRIQLGQAVRHALPGLVVTDHAAWSAGHIVNCAGLYADRIAQSFGVCDDYAMLPFKGVYRYGNWQPGTLRRHVYPVPDPRNPFLGVHATVTVSGRVKIGPTAIPVLSRENYRWLRGLRPQEAPEALVGLWRFLASDAHESWPLVRGETRRYSHRALASDAAELVPAIRPADFTERGRPGIRAQLARRDTGALEMDFVVRGDGRSTHVLNAVSPAWTSSLAFAEHVVAGMARNGAA